LGWLESGRFPTRFWGSESEGIDRASSEVSQHARVRPKGPLLFRRRCPPQWRQGSQTSCGRLRILLRWSRPASRSPASVGRTRNARHKTHGTDDSNMGLWVARQHHWRLPDRSLALARTRLWAPWRHTHRSICFCVPPTLVGGAFKKFKLRHYRSQRLSGSGPSALRRDPPHGYA
jgi:hypothetical protein